MLVERLGEKDTSLYRPALEELRRQIRSSTTSMTSVPKPLKFLRPHYGKLKEIYENMAPGENKVKQFQTWWRPSLGIAFYPDYGGTHCESQAA
ncbi:PREDICTED: 26S proteasome non-ATPase regulatory subunit 2-like [Colobus angolensis palliatus]|uniref:26S proteasome non-ATPase regulatory subunit 2-like n=1 Tax=Colobus angolensis palliatus TaxID=336983 RepID=UPI0005F57E2F|nr:PREDICTED: 26S proteasome non-ATPase regulatory subunit 2-like [Colobus angolensis palliatus]